jgi:hypothetical protein
MFELAKYFLSKNKMFELYEQPLMHESIHTVTIPPGHNAKEYILWVGNC